MRHGTTSKVTFITITEKSVILKLKLIKILPEIVVQKFNPIERWYMTHWDNNVD